MQCSCGGETKTETKLIKDLTNKPKLYEIGIMLKDLPVEVEILTCQACKRVHVRRKVKA